RPRTLEQRRRAPQGGAETRRAADRALSPRSARASPVARALSPLACRPRPVAASRVVGVPSLIVVAMGGIPINISELVGNTPLVALPRMLEATDAAERRV